MIKRTWKYNEEGKCAWCGAEAEGKASGYGVELCMTCLFKLASEDDEEEDRIEEEERLAQEKEKPRKKTPQGDSQETQQQKLF